MNPTKQLEALSSTIPQLYEASNGDNKITFSFDGTELTRWSFIALTPGLNDYVKKSIDLLENIKKGYVFMDDNHHEVNRLKEFFAAIWLENTTKLERNFWYRIFDYFYLLTRRTNENNFIHKNIKIILDDSITTTGISLLDQSKNKFFDLLGTTPTSCIVVNKNLEIIRIESLDSSKMKRPDDYVLYPDFISDLAQSSEDNEILLTSTVRSDLFICHKKNMIASKRRDHWTVYDAATFKNTLAKIAKDYRLGCNLYGILFDLSYKRHGGLIVLDNKNNFTRYTKGSDELNPLIPSIKLNEATFPSSSKKIVAEFSSVDGAILVSKEDYTITGIGKIINVHPLCSDSYGARTTAALSAALHGGTSFKVSSDGDITLYFKTDKTGNEIIKIKYL